MLKETTPQAPQGQAELSAGLKAAANLIGDVRGIIIFARENMDISADSLLATWIKQAPEHVRAVNVYEDLVRALKSVHSLLDKYPGITSSAMPPIPYDSTETIGEIVNRAIAKAEA